VHGQDKDLEYNYTFSRISWILDSVCLSSSEGLGGMFAADANCEYVWNSVSVLHSSVHSQNVFFLKINTWVSSKRACCRS